MVFIPSWLDRVNIPNVPRVYRRLEPAKLRPDVRQISDFNVGASAMLRYLEIFKNWEFNASLHKDLKPLLTDIEALRETYSSLLNGSIDYAEKGQGLAHGMCLFLDRILDHDGKGKGTAEMLKDLVALGNKVTHGAGEISAGFATFRDQLNGFSETLDRLRISFQKRQTTPKGWRTFMHDLASFLGLVGTAIATLSTLLVSSGIPAGGVVAAQAGWKLGTAMATVCKGLAAMFRDDEEISDEAKFDKLMEVIKTMDSELTTVVDHSQVVGEWWTAQRQNLTSILNKGDRFKVTGGKAGMEMMREVQGDWKQAEMEFQKYITEVAPHQKRITMDGEAPPTPLRRTNTEGHKAHRHRGRPEVHVRSQTMPTSR